MGGESGRTALYRASQMNHIASLRLVLKAPGVKINIEAVNGITPSGIACYYNLPDVMKILLSDPRFEFHPNPTRPGVVLACQYGHGRLVHLLVTIGATKKNFDVNRESNYGRNEHFSLLFALKKTPLEKCFAL